MHSTMETAPAAPNTLQAAIRTNIHHKLDYSNMGIRRTSKCRCQHTQQHTSKQRTSILSTATASLYIYNGKLVISHENKNHIPFFSFYINYIKFRISTCSITNSKSYSNNKPDNNIRFLFSPSLLSGALSFNGEYPSDGLVGIQVQFPTGGVPMVLRTIQTGTATEFSEPEKITSAYTSDADRQSCSSPFYSGADGYFSMVVANQDRPIRGRP